MAFQQGDYHRASALHEEALTLFRALGAQRGITSALTNLGVVAARLGDYERALTLSRESLLLSRAIGAGEQAVENLEIVVLVAAARKQAGLAARLDGAVAALREALDVPMRPYQRSAHDQAVRAIRAALGEDRFTGAWAEGRALPLEDAVLLALEHDWILC
jgi:tetratricopeptide (TPR) repeat protein